MLLNLGFRACGGGAGILHAKKAALVAVPARGKRVWARKPLGAPVARSKLFRVPARVERPLDETQEMQRLMNNYKTLMKSIRQYFFEQAQKQADTGESAKAKLRLEEDEHRRLMEENRLDNERTALVRQQRLDREAEETRQRALSTLDDLEARQQRLKQELLAFVARQEASTEQMIGRDDIEAAIEAALAQPQNLQFALNRAAYVLRGRETNVDNIPEDQRERLSAA